MSIKKFFNMILWTISNRAQRVKLLRKQGVQIGEGCEIYRDVNFGSEPYLIKIGNRVRVTSGVKFCTHDGGMWVLREMYEDMRNADLFGKIEIGDNVHIGWNTVIMPGVKIGNNALIGCGAVVTRDIPDNSVAVGVPARVIKTIDEYYDKAKLNAIMTAKMSGDEKKEFIISSLRKK